MKIPKIATVRQALIAVAAFTIAAIMLWLFGPLAIGLLLLVACVAAIYAAALEWAPELFASNEPPAPQ